ncbi:MAG TPA: hypothetical protein VIF62_02810, partial [Labilithrix sp.]
PPAATPPAATTPPPPPADDPGPPPAGCPDIKPDGDGFFTRSTSATSYVGYVPKSYDGKPMRLVVGMHGCGDDAYNFATWAVAPWDSRGSQDWIGISIDGASGGGSCWSTKDDTSKVLAAIDDIRTCYYVHQQEIVLQGYSSGGEIGYAIALANASKFAGLLIEDSGLYATGQADALLANATRKIPIAHLTHQDDPVFPIDQVQSDWTKIKGAGFPLQTDVTPGDHNGTSDDWVQWLHPKMSGWKL